MLPLRGTVSLACVLACIPLLLSSSARSAEPAAPQVVKLWPGTPPNETRTPEPERDLSGPDGRKVAGKTVIRLGHVFEPTLEIYQPAANAATGTAVVICPGGGHRILAYDLEGTEVAQWLASLGVTGIVLKYRVPARAGENRWAQSVEDAQRAMSTVRGMADKLKLNPERIGICGFSAGGQAAALTALFGNERTYEAVDATDRVACRPDFALLIYPAYLTDQSKTKLHSDVEVTAEAPPIFLVHAWDDPVTAQSSLLLASALKQVKVPAELHLFVRGGHGYGLRRTEEPVTRWPEQAAAWLKSQGLLEK